MTYATPYDRQFSFSAYSAEFPDEQQRGTDLDVEFNAVKATIDEMLANVRLIQNSDGALARGSVGQAQLDSSISLGFGPPAVWQASTGYDAYIDTVFKDNKFYIANQDHTSGVSFDETKWDELADFTVANQLEEGGVVESMLADGAVTVSKIGANAVTTAKISTSAVETAKIADGAVTAAKLGASAVETAKINNLAVTEGKLADGAVAAAKIASNAVTADKILAAAVTTAKINDDAVTAAKMGPAGSKVVGVLTPAANKFVYYTAADAGALADVTAFARTFLDDADAAAARATLGLGTIAVEAATTYAKINDQTANTATAFPIGAILLVWADSNSVDRNATATVYYYSGNNIRFKLGSGTGVALSGTWRACGVDEESGYFLMQRVS